MAPFGTYAVLILLVIFIVIYRIEKTRHENRLKSIPVRIWVNGTRGKSSVTRLIAAGLRAGGKKTLAKTTGTSPRFIMADGSEQPVSRLGMANISEQIRIVRKAQRFKPEAIVLECMALRPDLQRTEAIQIVEPNIVVITNVRPDHLDVMGPTTRDIARAFINAIPSNCQVFASEPHIFSEYIDKMHKKNMEFSISKSNKVSDKSQSGFPYLEHKENIALALDVCRHFGIEEKIALQGMQSMLPDPGALKEYLLRLDSKQVTLINAMAANDPESIHRIWTATDKNYTAINLLINCRADRIDRSFQIADLIRMHMEADHYVLTGKGTGVLRKQLQKVIGHKAIVDLGGRTPEQTINTVKELVTDRSLLFALGNTVGFGVMMIEEFLKYRHK